MLRRRDQGRSRGSQGNLRQRIHSAALLKRVLDSARLRRMSAANLEQGTIRFHTDSAAIRSRKSSFGRGPEAALILSRTWDTFDVAGITQVIAGFEMTNLRRTCAHVVQLISAAHSGSDLLPSLRKRSPPAKGRFAITATPCSLASGKRRRSASRSPTE